MVYITVHGYISVKILFWERVITTTKIKNNIKLQGQKDT